MSRNPLLLELLFYPTKFIIWRNKKRQRQFDFVFGPKSVCSKRKKRIEIQMALARLEESNAAMTRKLSNFTGRTEMLQRKKENKQESRMYRKEPQLPQPQLETSAHLQFSAARSLLPMWTKEKCAWCGAIVMHTAMITNAMSWVPFTGVEVSNDNDKIILVNVHTTCCIKKYACRSTEGEHERTCSRSVSQN